MKGLSGRPRAGAKGLRPEREGSRVLAQQPRLPAAGQEARWGWRKRMREEEAGRLPQRRSQCPVCRLVSASAFMSEPAPPSRGSTLPPPLSLLTTPPAPFAPAPSLLPAVPFSAAPPTAFPTIS